MAVQDLAWVMIFLVFFAILILVATYLADSIFPEIKDMIGDEGDALVDSANYAFTVLDYVFLIVAVGVVIGVGVLAWRVNVSGIFIIFSILVIVILVGVLAPTFKNVMWEMFNTTQFAGYEADYPIMSKIFEHYPVFITIASAILLIVMYARYKHKESEGE